MVGRDTPEPIRSGRPCKTSHGAGCGQRTENPPDSSVGSVNRLTLDEIYAIRHHMGGFDSAARGGDYSLSAAFERCPLAVMTHLADMEATYLSNESEGL